MKNQADQNRLFSYACNKLYYKKIIDEYKVGFSDKKFGEDYDFNIAFFSHVNNLCIVEKGYYHYIKKNEESLTERYIPDFYEINRNRFEKMINLLLFWRRKANGFIIIYKACKCSNS